MAAGPGLLGASRTLGRLRLSTAVVAVVGSAAQAWGDRAPWWPGAAQHLGLPGHRQSPRLLQCLVFCLSVLF